MIDDSMALGLPVVPRVWDDSLEWGRAFTSAAPVQPERDKGRPPQSTPWGSVSLGLNWGFKRRMFRDQASISAQLGT